MPATPDAILALDVGEVRIGVALASAAARLPRPLTTLTNNADFMSRLQTILEHESAGTLVIGLPRGLSGQETAQTAYVRNFALALQALPNLKVHFQDEALSSQRAKAELEARGKIYEKADIDALAATFILEDYLTEGGN